MVICAEGRPSGGRFDIALNVTYLKIVWSGAGLDSYTMKRNVFIFRFDAA